MDGNEYPVSENSEKHLSNKYENPYSVKNIMIKNWISNEVFCWELTHQAIVFHTLWHSVKLKALFIGSELGHYVKQVILIETSETKKKLFENNTHKGRHFHLTGSRDSTALAVLVYCLKPKWLEYRLLIGFSDKNYCVSALEFGTQTRKCELCPFVQSQKCIYERIIIIIVIIICIRWIMWKGWELGEWGRYIFVLFSHNYFLVL